MASEVRHLAQRSASAAKEIKLLIDNSVEKVDTGAKLVNEAGSTMLEIVDSIRRVTGIMGEIAAASEEQTSGIEKVNLALMQMDQVTQQNASLVEQAAAATGAMQDQARDLSQAVSVFLLNATHSTFAVQAPSRAPIVSAASGPGAKTRMARVASETKSTAGRMIAPRARLPVAPAQGGDWEEF